ncbi:MAG: sensor histidine kinase [Puniceicoccaceae bacterium]|nr:MAG: sensor histidine kinase [Puniceicoccaceae bacterium]
MPTKSSASSSISTTTPSRLLPAAPAASPCGSASIPAPWSLPSPTTAPASPKAIRASLFEPFVTHGKAKGTGLAIVKAIVEAHEGTIHVESKPGAGTTFRIRLPASAD